MRSLLAAALLAAFNAQAADLLDVYRDALANDAQIASAQATLEAGREKLPQGRAGLLPTVTASANTTWNTNDITLRNSTPTFARDYNSNGYSVNLTQPLFRWQNWVQYDQAKFLVAQAEAQFAGARQDLALRVAQVYFDVLFAQDALAVARAQKAAISEQLEQARRAFEVGTATVVDTHEAQSRFDLAVAQELAAQNDLEVKRQALVQVVGKDPGALNPLRGEVQIQRPQPDDMQQWVQSSEQGNINVQVQQANVEVSAREVSRQRGGHFPTLDIVATHARNSMGNSTVTGVGSDVKTNTIGLQLAVPLFQGGATVSREREAAALKNKALADLENARRTAALSARQAYLGVTSGLAQVKALEAALASSQTALDSNKLGYEVGVRINIDVLNAQQQLFATRRDLAKARYDTLLAQLRLKSASGSLDDKDPERVNTLLQR
ncbi:MAG: TolC family outer membrane protein [Betaproteobacteria bacterium]|nr:TolC family outer membrane protein [Betaproteobacteria bacterium]